MDADANANANANADAGGSTIALRERCSGELKTMSPNHKGGRHKKQYKTFSGVLDFDLLPHPGVWTQEPKFMECKQTLQGTHDSSTRGVPEICGKAL